MNFQKAVGNYYKIFKINVLLNLKFLDNLRAFSAYFFAFFIRDGFHHMHNTLSTNLSTLGCHVDFFYIFCQQIVREHGKQH